MSQAPFLRDTEGPNEFYINGYNTGVNWNFSWNHLPGGPHVASNGHGNRDPQWAEYCKRSERRFHAWKLGWKHGAIHVGFTLAYTMDDPMLFQDEVDAILLHVVRSGQPNCIHMISALTLSKPAKAIRPNHEMLAQIARLRSDIDALERSLKNA